MEINFLVFPAPKCTFKEEDLKVSDMNFKNGIGLVDQSARQS